jgi:hypothetical protein
MSSVVCNFDILSKSFNILRNCVSGVRLVCDWPEPVLATLEVGIWFYSSLGSSISGLALVSSRCCSRRGRLDRCCTVRSICVRGVLSRVAVFDGHVGDVGI